MGSSDFLVLFFENIYTWVLCMFFVCILYYPVYKFMVRSILDPLFEYFSFTVFASVIPIFLYWIDVISLDHVIFFVASELLMWSVFVCLSRNSLTLSRKEIRNESIIIERMWLPIVLLTMALYLLLYSISGIPLLNESRFSGYSSSMYAVLINRLQLYPNSFVLFYGYYALDIGKHKRALFCFAVTLIFGFLGGSKAFILGLVHSYFMYNYLYKNKGIVIRKLFLVVIFFTPVLTLLMSQSSFIESVGSFLFRLVANGDTYWYAYPNDVIDKVVIDNPVANITYNFWGPFKNLLPLSVSAEDTEPIGFKVYEKVYGVEPWSGAPNTKPALVAWCCWGWFGLIFSLFVGLFASGIMSFIRKLPRSLIFLPIAYVLYSTALSMLLDVNLAMYKLFDVFLAVFVLICIVAVRSGKLINLFSLIFK